MDRVTALSFPILANRSSQFFSSTKPSFVDLDGNGVLDFITLAGGKQEALEPQLDIKVFREFAIANGQSLVTSRDLVQDSYLNLKGAVEEGNRSMMTAKPFEQFPRFAELQEEAQRRIKDCGIQKSRFSGPLDWGINVVDDQLEFFRPVHP